MSHSITAHIYDLASNLLADISGISLEKTLKRRHDMARTFELQSFSGHSLLTSVVAGDGLPNLRKGCRKLVVWEDGGPGDQPIFHGRITGVERVGDGTKNRVTITATDPLPELGVGGADGSGRPVRDGDGNFIDPTFFGTGTGGPDVISGPDLIFQALTNSMNGDPTLGEGAFPIALTGDFDLDVPPAVNLTLGDKMDWPIQIGDFISQLIATGVVDINLRPLDIGEDADPYKMVSLSAVSLFGTDLSGTVHFDYWTGLKNASNCRHVEDWTTICNKLFDYLGPRLDKEHWKGNITPTAPEKDGRSWDDITGDTSVEDRIAASRALYGGPDGGQMMVIRAFDTIGTESSVGNRDLYIQLWLGEHNFRVEPRDMLFITPAIDDKGLFIPPQDFDTGDLIAVNTGAAFGVALAEAQRVYGYDKTWSREGVVRISELITSADAE